MASMADFSVAGKHVVVVGAARSGIAAAELLRSRGARVTVTDLKRSIDEASWLGAAGVAFELGGHRATTFTSADLIVLSPGVPPDQPAIQAARAAGVPVIAEIELAARCLAGRIVAITGTKGKSTTTALVGRMLEEAGMPVLVGGNIGTAASAQVDRSTPEVLHVLEVSSFQLELTDTFHPWIAVLLNLTVDHLDRHGTVEAYRRAKARIFANQDASDWAVISADDPAVVELAREGRARVLPFALETTVEQGILVAGGAIVRRTASGDLPLVPLTEVKLRGRHLLGDVMAAAGVASLVGVPPAAMARAVGSFRGLEHALEPVQVIAGVQFVNDSKATNVAAARRAVESFESGLVVILGGRFKGGNLAELAPALAGRAGAVVAIGEARPLIRETLGAAVDVREAGTLAEAVRVAFTLAPPGGTVLLAPACASFDMFKDYAERGRVFKREVAALAAELAGSREQ